MADFPKQYDFKKIEEEIGAFWDKEKLVEKTVGYDAKKPLFSFLEGPPTANAPPGLHHVQSRLYKDLVCRFHYMKGFSVPRKGGWDCHGLPVEVQVEKKLGLATKKDVVKYGIDKFNRLCRDDVFTFIKEWDMMTKKMAFWIDLEHPYVTLTNDYIESVWWSLKELYRKDLLYESHKVVPYCPRCETPLSTHEVALGYKDVEDETVTVRFKLKNQDRFVLAWTTTPWTLPSNVGLAVNPTIRYAIVQHEGAEYILARSAADKYFPASPVSQEIDGQNLIGQEYDPLFDYFVGKLTGPAFRIIGADYVTTEDGTGIVHQSPAFGEQDFEACKKNGLAFVQPVDVSGKFTSDVPDFAGQFVKDADKEIIAKLEKQGALVKKEKYVHSTPFCWRCSTPLLYYALKSWFVRVTKHKEQLIELNNQIAWYPDTIKEGRFGDWLRNVKDWALSRNKFWGTPLPIWRCKACRKETVIGSREELEEAAMNKEAVSDLHKPAIDSVKISCTCGQEMQRVPQVIDTWYDSGAAPFAQLHYPFENKELFGKYYPYSFITESIDQTRGWFYTMHVLGTLLFGSAAYQQVVVGGLLVDEKGEKMSKSKGNILNPWEAFDTVGVDAVRLYLSSVAPWNSKRFGYGLVNESVAPMLTTLWNSCVFSNDMLTATHEGVSSLELEDKWVLSRVHSLIKLVTAELEHHNYHRCIEELRVFIMDDFSRWYIRIIRGRSDDAVSDTLRQVLSAIAKLLAPFAPYISEAIYLRLTGKSVHLAPWPKAEKTDEQLERNMIIARETTQALLSAREKMHRTLRWPVKEAIIVSSRPEVQEAVEAMKRIIADQANAKNVVAAAAFTKAKVRVKADYAKIGPLYGQATPAIIAQLSFVSSGHILKKLEETGSITVSVNEKQYEMKKEHFITETEIPENYVSVPFSLGAVYINTDMTREMEAEGTAREIVRRAQQARKDAGLDKTQRITAHLMTDKQTATALAGMLANIQERIGAKKLVISDGEPKEHFEHTVSISIKGASLQIAFSVVK